MKDSGKRLTSLLLDDMLTGRKLNLAICPVYGVHCREAGDERRNEYRFKLTILELNSIFLLKR